MKIVRSNEGKIHQGTTFTNKTTLNRLLPAQQEKGIKLSLVTFEDGALTHWHEHPGEQILYVLEGEGRVGNEKEEVRVSPGDVIYTRPGERHWHGAAPGKSMTHITITNIGSPTWFEKSE